jgi:hypothetical protein
MGFYKREPIVKNGVQSIGSQDRSLVRSQRRTKMAGPRQSLFALSLVLLLHCFGALAMTAKAQTQVPQSPGVTAAAARNPADFDVQLYVIIASDDKTRNTPAPRALEGVYKQLRETLALSSFRHSGTLVGRVAENSALEIKGVAGSNFVGQATLTAPIFYEFTMSGPIPGLGQDNLSVLNVNRVRFGLRVPIFPGTPRSDSAAAVPVVGYEPVGLNTGTSVREATPTVIGTLTTSGSDDIIVLVLSAKRAQ